ncbi:hypothetical protein M427DRAFT_50061 [Gonapodya prolifera JEL478]|uniref:Uncharacterized protein n=1 Tax=Gonapodya prolifera (strain JEL478) TaxID=1344416 RepID=A0A138ZWZ0_GONPJ|nr:hypothetical protein M427DRAFT_50061 [Gonapodya prolifera JEL478]|eukprot:KXS09029.1 hypothetical protein M427DRAFT_50061 [Gonapodya prolifera JEL478]
MTSEIAPVTIQPDGGPVALSSDSTKERSDPPQCVNAITVRPPRSIVDTFNAFVPTGDFAFMKPFPPLSVFLEQCLTPEIYSIYKILGEVRLWAEENQLPFPINVVNFCEVVEQQKYHIVQYLQKPSGDGDGIYIIGQDWNYSPNGDISVLESIESQFTSKRPSDVDFHPLVVQNPDQAETQKNTQGRPAIDIFISIETAQDLAMRLKSKNSDKIRKMFRASMEVMQRYERTQNSFISQRKVAEAIHSQIRKDFKGRTEVLYVAYAGDHMIDGVPVATGKVGYSKTPYARYSSLKHQYSKELLFTWMVACVDAEFFETQVKGSELFKLGKCDVQNWTEVWALSKVPMSAMIRFIEKGLKEYLSKGRVTPVLQAIIPLQLGSTEQLAILAAQKELKDKDIELQSSNMEALRLQLRIELTKLERTKLEVYGRDGNICQLPPAHEEHGDSIELFAGDDQDDDINEDEEPPFGTEEMTSHSLPPQKDFYSFLLEHCEYSEGMIPKVLYGIPTRNTEGYSIIYPSLNLGCCASLPAIKWHVVAQGRVDIYVKQKFSKVQTPPQT